MSASNQKKHDTTISPLGFGTSGIMGSALTNIGRNRLLNFVYDQGIQHFDTAPLYGMGEAELILGQFIKNKRDKVTITTKYGLAPTKTPKHLKLIKPIARYLNRRSKTINTAIKLLNRTKKVQETDQPTNTETQFKSETSSYYNCDDMESSLNTSLRKLNTDYVDFYLLHECNKHHINDEVVKRLEQFVSSGKVRVFGIATNRASTFKILSEQSNFGRIVQTANSILDEPTALFNSQHNKLVIAHSIFTYAYSALTNYINRNPEETKKWSSILDMDLSLPSTISSLLLNNALYENKDGCVLFSSMRKSKIKENCEVLTKQPLDAAQLDLFSKFVRMNIGIKS